MSSAQTLPPAPPKDPVGLDYDADESFRDSIGTLTADGKRRWIFARQPKGRYYNARTYLSLFYLVLFLAGPFIKINGHPLLMLNFLERKFVLLGQPFWPQDFHLFVLAFLTTIVFVALFTVAYGRIFCGWVCPQTVFMEMVFRRLEYAVLGAANAQRRLAAAPWTTNKVLRVGGLQALFALISVTINVFFYMYIVGYETALANLANPAAHYVHFIVLGGVSFAFFMVFTRFREQVCIAACPYGRLQGVLLDSNTIVVAYDHVRGEPRTKGKPKANAAKAMKPPVNKGGIGGVSVLGADTPELAAGLVAPPWQRGGAGGYDVQTGLPHPPHPPLSQGGASTHKVGDCVSCNACVAVCPTGIDIRNGTQLECTNCTACIDACDDIMRRLNRPEGLIRYASRNEITEGRKFRFTTRMKAYTAILVGLLVVLGALIFMRAELEVTVQRQPGSMYQTLPNGHLSNIYSLKMVNKTLEDKELEFRLLSPEAPGAAIRLSNDTNHMTAPAETVSDGLLIVELPKDAQQGVKTKLEIGLFVDGQQIETIKTNFMGSGKQ